MHIENFVTGSYAIKLKRVGKLKDCSVIDIPELGTNKVCNDVQVIIQYQK